MSDVGERNEEELRAALRLLAAASAGEAAPEKVEAALREAFRQHNGGAVRIHSGRRRQAWKAAIAAGILVALAGWMSRVGPPSARPAAVSPAGPPAPFLPLPYLGPVHTVESGQVLRVQLPKAALVALGLPMHSERAAEPVTADVLFGEDGMARAIRFVQ